MMKQIIFVTGGCRSGKSRHALSLAETYMNEDNRFIATCVARDEEMKDRVRNHQAERNDRWATVEEPVKLAEILMAHDHTADVILVDCLTLWINNLLMEDFRDSQILESSRHLAGVLDSMRCPVVIVSNEVGSGIVPENQLARRFRDLAGFANQQVAACADRVIWMVAGIAVQIK